MQGFSRLLKQQPMVVYMGVIMLLLWLASIFDVSSFWLFSMAFLFLLEADRNCTKNLRREVRTEERRSASQGRPLSDFESAEWINQAVEKLWPMFLEKFISEELLKPMVPWFLDKHKPWTVRKATLQRLELGQNPPRFMGVRTLRNTSGDDDLVMEFCLDFAAAENMDAVLSVQMRRRLGLGIKTNIHISRLQIEGKVRVGLKFSNGWPFLSRIRVCFENSPYVQMTARPLSTHGVNVSELPLVAGWMERMVADVFEQSLVEPNMLVLDIEKLTSCITTLGTSDSSMQDDWFSIQERAPIAILHLKILEASELKPADINGLADPFIRGSFTTCRFKTKVQRKTLEPRWFEEFEVPIASWELPTLLVLRVRDDKDQVHDDDLGFCEIDITQFRGGVHHDFWIPLQNAKMGRLHLALIIREDGSCRSTISIDQIESNRDEWDDKSLTAERLEIINLGKGKDGYLSIVSPGQPLRTKSWQQRHGLRRRASANNQKEVKESMHTETFASSSSEEDSEDKRTKTKPRKRVFWGRRARPAPSPRIANDDQCPSAQNHNEYIAVGTKGTTVRMKVEDPSDIAITNSLHDDGLPEANAILGNPSKRSHMKNMAKGLMKHAGKTAQHIGAALNRKGSSKKLGAEDEEVISTATPSTMSEQALSMESETPEGSMCDVGCSHEAALADEPITFDEGREAPVPPQDTISPPTERSVGDNGPDDKMMQPSEEKWQDRTEVTSL